MESAGLYFYFLCWVVWIISTFFFQKSTIRTFLSVVLLLLIASSTTYVDIFGFTTNVAFLVILATSFILLIKTMKQKYILLYLSITTLSLAYVCFCIFEIFDPVWILFNRTWLLSFILLYLALMLFKGRMERFVFMLAGITQGEIFKCLLWKNVFAYSVMGEFDFLAVLTLSLAGMSTWVLFETITVYLDAVIQKRVKEKQG
ncbi:hypothetical protein FIU87_12235 [Bacillus sp. THAF10]|uniref:YphA family membrane protein n=1 Tax=Bacillus sp. THAF10 TaxID=2587848 RepID=UPI001268F4F0|nr:hypothetical protein [Bacillus sp. THAF10]QFT89418.1 hypothetical protein FIU87_12235 [Bacillus sp. THAF10]